MTDEKLPEEPGYDPNRHDKAPPPGALADGTFAIYGADDPLLAVLGIVPPSLKGEK